MLNSCVEWPAEDVERYRELGYWIDEELCQILERQMQSNPSAIAVIDNGNEKTYRCLDKEATRLAGYLAKQGLSAGDTAIVQLPNCYEFYVVFFALQKLAVLPVNALMNHNQLELTHYAQALNPKLIIADAKHPLFADGTFTEQLKMNAPQLAHVLLRGQTNWTRSLTEKLYASASFEHFDSLPFRKHQADNVAFFQLSGGSTGTPKLIPRTHNDYYYSVRQSVEVCQWDEQTRYLCALPAAHNFPLSSPGALGVFYAGGTVICAPDPSPSSCFALIQKHRVNWTALVPPAVTLWLDSQERERYNLSTLAVIQVGGAKLSATLAARLENELQVTLQQVFGMAEGLVNYTRLDDDQWTRHNTQGRPMSEADQIRIVDENNQPVPDGEAGLLTTKGPYTFRGYLNAELHNLAAFTAEGFYCSGDVVKLSPCGNIIVEGRDKDQINKGGEKVAAEEVENQLLAHPSVHDCAVVAMPDSLLGERICAFVVAREHAEQPLTKVALNRFIRGRGLADYKYPDRFEFIATLPKTKVGKVDKRALREHIANLLASVQNV
ncbi:(2,3-dihydroxybenzoyl)adenylate synthase [Pseudoalteromonas sp. S16_S37]|uniref:(2,3-dihydroxybenzoyl)adenylate synthase n=1 Tax=Pseudoalteromonas sp. S16_S37 TaxID=2720228 RepID=UPI0016812479|nr:(2,3-dihydroxybenzoyl)adenylate synthase [Pseudoalteromonas sp. S16_S37]MBD1583979.1 (2,3-dihydroxybenzoyl)adenylate synthase [Pseudoalteromonas sp. S16_S37]